MSAPEPKGKPLPGTFILAQIASDWHVMFAPDHLPNHYLSVARFQEYSRARRYAELEEMAHGDDYERPMDLDMRAIQKVDLTDIKPCPPKEPRSLEPPPKANANRPLSDLEAEIKADLPSLMETHPRGVSVAEFSEWLGEPDHAIRDAMMSLKERGDCRVVQRLPDRRLCLVPAGIDLPPCPPDERSDALLNAMEDLERDGIVRASQRLLSEKSGVHANHIVATAAVLVGQGRIELVDRGGPQISASYRIIRKEAA